MRFGIESAEPAGHVLTTEGGTFAKRKRAGGSRPRAVMKKRSIKTEQLAKMLSMNPVMVEKLLWGKIHRSSHLEKQMIKVLEIKEQRVKNLAQRYQLK